MHIRSYDTDILASVVGKMSFVIGIVALFWVLNRHLNMSVFKHFNDELSPRILIKGCVHAIRNTLSIVFKVGSYRENHFSKYCLALFPNGVHGRVVYIPAIVTTDENVFVPIRRKEDGGLTTSGKGETIYKPVMMYTTNGELVKDEIPVMKIVPPDFQFIFPPVESGL